MTITIIPNQIPSVTQSLMSIYSAAKQCTEAFRLEYPDYNEIIIEATATEEATYANLNMPARNSTARLQLFVHADALENDICALVLSEMTVVSEAC